MDLFQQASRLKFRFTSPKGLLTVEDLWDLPLSSEANKANLDDIARGLFIQLKDDTNVSFVLTKSASDQTIQLKFDVVKHIIDVRLAENEAIANARAKKEQKQRLMAIIEQKESEALGSKSLDELRKMVSEL